MSFLAAVFSDVHADAQALEAVLRAVDATDGVDALWCLGDFCSGAGDAPAACHDLVTGRCDVVLAGNHEHFVLMEVWRDWPEAWWAKAARRAREHLDDRQLTVLGGLRSLVRIDRALLVHGALTDPVDDFIGGASAARVNAALLAQAGCDTLLFGHTHQPIVWRGNDGDVTAVQPAVGETVTTAPGELLLANPGAACDRGGPRWLTIRFHDDGRRDITLRQEPATGRR